MPIQEGVLLLSDILFMLNIPEISTQSDIPYYSVSVLF